MSKNLKSCIIEICKSYQWFLDQADDENAIIALKQCLNELRKNKPKHLYKIGTSINEYYDYIKLIIPFKAAIDKQQYSRACCELSTLAIKEDILQARIYFNIISILQHLE